MAKKKQKKIRVPKTMSLPEALLADDGKSRVHEIRPDDERFDSGKADEADIKAKAKTDEADTKAKAETDKKTDTKSIAKSDKADYADKSWAEEAVSEDKSWAEETVPETKNNTEDTSSVKNDSAKAGFHSYPSLEFTEISPKRRALRIVALVAALVGTMMLAVVVGTGLALYDMNKSVSDLTAAIFDSKPASPGLTFADASEMSTGGSESIEDSGEDGKGAGLTFYDPNEAETAKADASEGEAAQNLEDAAESADDGMPDSDSASGEDSDDGKAKSGDVVDGSMVVSAELAGLKSIKRAGQSEVMPVTTVDIANATNPDDVYPLDFTAVDESYFEDALFVGDSRFYGFCMWSGIPGTNYCATSFNIFNYETFKVVQTGNGKVPIFNVLPYNAFTKIYIKVGLNEMGTSEAAFEAKYAELIARLREMEPRAIIYIHAVLPVTASKSSSDKTHNNPNIVARNASLKEFAKEQKAYYIDASPALIDENGCLKSEMTNDGIHMASRYMGVWKQYLMEHAVVVPE